MKERIIWGIHGGKTGDADSLFLRKNYVGINGTHTFIGTGARTAEESREKD